VIPYIKEALQPLRHFLKPWIASANPRSWPSFFGDPDKRSIFNYFNNYITVRQQLFMNLIRNAP